MPVALPDSTLNTRLESCASFGQIGPRVPPYPLNANERWKAYLHVAYTVSVKKRKFRVLALVEGHPPVSGPAPQVRGRDPVEPPDEAMDTPWLRMIARGK
jgi:hypothetical protein